MTISIIAAVADSMVIGNDNKLLWHLPADLKFFKEKTTGHYIVMGRKTFESIGGGKPLPNRISIVVSRQTNYTPAGCLVAHSLHEALELAKGEDEVFVIGGGEIYKEALELAHRMYITRVHCNVGGDVRFPLIDLNEWTMTDSLFKAKDEKNAHDMTFEVYKRTH